MQDGRTAAAEALPGSGWAHPKKANLSRLLGLWDGERLAVVGCGGKTSLVGLLARENRHRKVLVLPTTHILPMDESEAVFCSTRALCLAHRPQTGVQCMAVMDKATGSYGGLPAADLPGLAQGYDLVLTEADGSRMLPCKGWLETEPVVPDFATRTIGVVTTVALGRPATGQWVHRPGLFAALTGQREGELIGIRALAAMVGEEEGMFRTARGERILMINKVEDAAARQAAGQLAMQLRRHYPGAVHRIFCGSVLAGSWAEL